MTLTECDEHAVENDDKHAAGRRAPALLARGQRFSGRPRRRRRPDRAREGSPHRHVVQHPRRHRDGQEARPRAHRGGHQPRAPGPRGLAGGRPRRGAHGAARPDRGAGAADGDGVRLRAQPAIPGRALRRRRPLAPPRHGDRPPALRTPARGRAARLHPRRGARRRPNGQLRHDASRLPARRQPPLRDEATAGRARRTSTRRSSSSATSTTSRRAIRTS